MTIKLYEWTTISLFYKFSVYLVLLLPSFFYEASSSVYGWEHDITNKMTCAPSKDSDQPGHLPSHMQVFTVCPKKLWVLTTHKVHSEDSDQTGCTGHFLGFAVLQLNFPFSFLVSGITYIFCSVTSIYRHFNFIRFIFYLNFTPSNLWGRAEQSLRNDMYIAKNWISLWICTFRSTWRFCLVLGVSQTDQTEDLQADLGLHWVHMA